MRGKPSGSIGRWQSSSKPRACSVAANSVERVPFGRTAKFTFGSIVIAVGQRLMIEADVVEDEDDVAAMRAVVAERREASACGGAMRAATSALCRKLQRKKRRMPPTGMSIRSATRLERARRGVKLRFPSRPDIPVADCRTRVLVSASHPRPPSCAVDSPSSRTTQKAMKRFHSLRVSRCFHSIPDGRRSDGALFQSDRQPHDRRRAHRRRRRSSI